MVDFPASYVILPEGSSFQRKKTTVNYRTKIQSTEVRALVKQKSKLSQLLIEQLIGSYEQGPSSMTGKNILQIPLKIT